MHSIVTTFRGADIKVEVANFCAAMDTLIDQDALTYIQIFSFAIACAGLVYSKAANPLFINHNYNFHKP